MTDDKKEKCDAAERQKLNANDQRQVVSVSVGTNGHLLDKYYDKSSVGVGTLAFSVNKTGDQKLMQKRD